MNVIVIRIVSMLACVGLIVLMAIGLYGGWLATHSLWPGFHEDSTMYSTVVINRASGLGDTFDVYTRMLRLANGRNDFNLHGQLYYPVVAFLMRGTGYDSFLRLVHLSNLIAFILSLLLFYFVPRRRLGCSRLVSGMCAVASAFAISSVLQYLQGRPDHGIVLVLLLSGLIGEFFFRERVSPLFLGIQIGVIAAISPFPGYLVGVFSVFGALLGSAPLRRVIIDATISLIAAGICWAALTAIVYPGPLMDLFVKTVSDGAKDHAGLFSLYYKFPAINISRFAKSWVTIKFAPLLIMPFALVSLIVVALSLRKSRSDSPLLIRIIVLAFLFILPGQLWFFVVYWPEINYSLLGLFPAIFLWILRQAEILKGMGGFAFRLEERNRNIRYSIDLSPGNMIVAGVFIYAIIVFMPGLGYLRSSLLQRSVLNDGVSFEAARERYQDLKKTLAEDEYILISEYSSPSGRSPVVLSGPPWKTRASVLGNNLNDSFTSLRAKYYFVLQDQLSDTNIPETTKGYRLIEKRFTPTPVVLGGMRISSVIPGYAYAIYEKEADGK